MNDRLVWIDCEMTGLDLTADALVEIAVVVTDYRLTVLEEGLDLVIRPPATALEQMGDVVREMHTASGLLSEFPTGLALPDAEERILAHIRRFVPEPRKAPIAGNSIGTDRMFLARDMPELESWLHYRVVDVSSIKELARHWFPRAYFAAPAKTGNHRALSDILDSIDELRYYRETVFVADPGPDTESARTAATAIAAARADGP